MNVLPVLDGWIAMNVVYALIAYTGVVWPVSVGVAAKVLGVGAPKLRRWINEGRFEDIPGLSWTQDGFARQRRLTKSWVAAVAKRINVEPDWSAVNGTGSE